MIKDMRCNNHLLNKTCFTLFLVMLALWGMSYSTVSAESYKYDSAGRLIRVDYENGKSIAYTYDKNGSLLKKESGDSGDVILPQTLAEITAIPEMLKSSFLAKPVTVTALDQNGDSMAGVTINAAASEGRVSVRPASAVTDVDGSAQFRVRFGFFSTGGEIIFTAEGFTAAVTQE
ncbi:MAG: hypothetical protein ACUZ8H_09235 [Candidatus Anammoxibacter sp.]